MFPDWLVYGFAIFGVVCLVGQLVAGVVTLVQRARMRRAVPAYRKGAWP